MRTKFMSCLESCLSHTEFLTVATAKVGWGTFPLACGQTTQTDLNMFTVTSRCQVSTGRSTEMNLNQWQIGKGNNKFRP